MAQPPNVTDTFLREVDENLRRDRLQDFAKKYGSWIVTGVVIFLAASGGWIYWKQRQAQQAETKVEQLSQVYRDIAAGNARSAPQQVDALAADSRNAVRASALLTRAALALEQNDVKLATAKFREIVADDGLPKPYRDLALIRQTTLEFDSLKPDEVIARMRPLATPGGPWFGSAAEMTGAALIKQGKKQEAGRLFAQIAKDRSVPDTLRTRAVQIAGSLGVDASSALAAPAQ